ncbi:MAG TPA: HD domain-containing phosphohydrolase [Syntrophomonadaceae bacterium]|nr:HD domain-containing phosphohydrolase [Syntrophomonadaceae bacterium]
MDYKLRLKIGLVITALVTAILLSDLLPAFFTALVFFIVSCGLTYFSATDYVKERKIKEMAVIIKGLESISSPIEKKEIFHLLEIWLKKIVKSDESFLFIRGMVENARWDTLLELYKDETTVQLVEDKTILPDEVQAALYIPCLVKDVAEASIILADYKEGNLKPFHIKLVEPLINTATNIIENIKTKDLEKTWEKDLFLALAEVMEGYTPKMIGHGQRVARIAELIGRRLGLTEEELKDLEYGALLHDIGQSAVLYRGLNPELTDEKLDHNSHTILGADLIPDGDQYLEIRGAILSHHEHYDGTGYPEGLSYTDIPLIARIIAVADTYDALTYLASEEERIGHDTAIAYIRRSLGTRFDPLVVVGLEEVEGEVSSLLKEGTENADI